MSSTSGRRFRLTAATVAFESDRGGRRGIWLISSEGGSPRRLVDAESIGGLSWTHDGRAVLYAAAHERWPGLFKVAVADGQVQRVPTKGVATDPACSPSDGVVAYMSPRMTGTPFTELGSSISKGTSDLATCRQNRACRRASQMVSSRGLRTAGAWRS